MSALIQELSAAIRADIHEARERAHVAICESKQRYPTKRDAKVACRNIARRGRNPNLTPYQCPTCQQWHLKRRT
jgi:hypothetical protein